MTKHVRLLVALALCLATLAASPATSPAGATTEGKTKLSATLLDKKVKTDKPARIKGQLDVDTRDGRSLEPIIVQKLVAGVWVNVLTTDCRPNYTFRLSVSFSIAAEYSLRVYHPSTAVYSSTMLLAVF
jgi:hypothetical protein